MTDRTDAEPAQPDARDALEATAVELISELVQEAFLSLDPLPFVRARATQLSAVDQQTVADLIDSAVVEIEVGFDDDDHHDHDHE